MEDRRKSKSAERISTDTLSALKEAPGPEVIWDSSLTGLGLRTRGRTDHSAWRWIYVYRHRTRNKQVTLTLGSPIVHTPEEARRWAKDAAKKANTSDDLYDAKQRELEAHAAERGRPTLKQLWEEWREAEGSAKKDADKDLQRWNTHIEPRLGKMKVAAITPRDVNKLKTDLKETPVTANRCIALLSVMFTYAVAHQFRAGCAPEHPIKGGVVKRYKETPIDFHFTPEQMGRLLEAAEADENKAAGLAVRMLALTGARLSEVLQARWDQLSPRADGRLTWTVERTNTKTGEPYQRTLDPDLSRRLLEWRPISLAVQKVVAMKSNTEDARLMIFPNMSGRDSKRNIIEIQGPWVRIKAAAGVESGRIHDLRHSVATTIVRETGSLEAAKRQLGHTTIVTTQRYAHHTQEMSERTSDLLASHAEQAIAKARADKNKAEVVPISGCSK